MNALIHGERIKKQVRLFFDAIVTATISVFLLIGCGDGNPANSGNGANLILNDGKAWVGCTNLFGEYEYCSGYIFKPNGIFLVVVYSASNDSWKVFEQEHKWSINGNQLIMTIVNCTEYIIDNSDAYCASTSETTNKYTYKLSGDELTLSEGESGATFKVQDITGNN
jgi:hypothetical protein